MRKITLTLLLTLLSLCAYSQLALEGFEAPWTGTPAAPPGGWVVYKQIGNITWAQSPTGNTQIPPYQGTNAAYLNKENVTPGSPIPTNWLITPQFNSPTQGLLHFYSRMIYPGDYGSIFKIKIAVVTDPTVPAADLPWVDLVPPMGEMEMNPIQQQYVEKTMNIPATYDGQQIRIAFIMVGDDQERWLIDNVEVISVCNPPSTLTATNNYLTSIDLNWTNPGGITTWEVEITQASNAATGTGEIYTGTLPYHKTGLITDTDYKFYVRSVCSDGGKSAWIGPVNFSTTKIGEKCNAPIVIPNTTLPYTNVNNTALFDNFYGGAPGTGCGTTATYLNGNDVVYSYTPTFTGNIYVSLSNTLANAGVFVYSDCNLIGISCIAGALATATAPAIIQSIPVTAGTTYYFVVSSQFTTIPYTFTVQQVNCNAPSGLTASGQTSVSANLSWAANGATSWQIMVQPADAGFPLIAGQNVTQNTNLLVTSTTSGIPLAAATNYEYYVRSSCTNGTFSTWTGPFAFSTIQVSASLPYAEFFEGSHGWSILNGIQPNKWIVGNSNMSSKSLYITNDNGLNNLYTINTNSVVQAYRDIQIPTGATLLGLTFDLKAGGEVNDYVRAWLVPTSFIPTPGTQISAANSGGIQIGGNYNLAANWTTKTDIANVTGMGGTTRRLVFEWRNNANTGTQPAAAIDNVNVALVTCAPPTALAVSTSTPSSATFTWTAASTGSPGSYEYYYSQSPVAPTPTTTEMGSVTGTTVTISPLSENETYYMWVRSNCGGNKSFWTGGISVLTPQTPVNVPYTQNFDGAESYFTLVNGASLSTWFIGQATSNSPTKSLYITTDNGVTNSYDSSSATAVQAYKDITIPATATDINVSFDYKSMGDANDYIRVWLVPATFFPSAGTQITAAASGGIQLGGNFQGYENWTNIIQEANVTAFQGQKRRLVFEWRNNGLGLVSPPAAIDNINVSIVVCQRPTALTVTNITSTSATLDWTQAGSATNWEVVHMPLVGAVPPTAATVGTPVSGNSEYTPPAGTFVPGTQYVFYVRTNCGGSAGNSNWSGPYMFALKPLNDECAQATVIPVNTTSACTTFASGNITGSTGSAQPSTCGGTKDDDIWFEFTATSTKHLITLKNLAGSDTNVWHTLYSGTDCTTLTEMYCSNITVSFAQGLVVGQTYKIRVYTNTATPNQTTTFDICITTPPPTPANDECTGAIALTVNPTLYPDVMTFGTVEAATPSGTATTCTGTPDDDVWYSFVATNVTHKISLLQIQNDAAMNIAVYSGNCGALTQIYCNGVNQTALWANNLVVGQTYWVRIYSFGNFITNTTFQLTVTTAPPAPANDNCATPTVVQVNPTLECVETAHGDILSATASTEPDTCNNANDDDDIWFQFTATSTSHIIEFKNFVGQGFALVSNFTNLDHALYSGASCATMTQLYCNTNNNSLATGLTIGQVYKIRVFSATPTANQQCAFDVCITTPPATIPNDNCSGAIQIPVNPDSYCNVHASGTVFGATPSPVANSCTGTADDDVWFEFTATNATHLIYIDKITGTSNQLYYSIYSGDCGSLNLLNCNPSTAGAYNNFIVGNTYKIRVYTLGTGNQSTSFNICVRIPNVPVDVNDSLYTHEELVTQVLFNTPCATVSNVTSVSGLNYGTVPSIGYFDAANSFFPFKYGVVLTTNDVNLAEGPYSYNSGASSADWLGDDELNDFILQNNPGNDNGTHNASALEFDFVPMINNFEFEFLFASAEYGSFQCNFGDAFAFILTDEDGNKQNLAVIPNTDIPVSVVNIRNEEFNNNCGSQNISYFGQYNASQGLASAINFNGQTIPMTASAIVVPGQTYHIKLVIANYSDISVASAIFLGGGTFNIGTLDLGVDLTVADGTALCDTETVVLDTHLTADPYTFTWFKDGVVIPDADEPTYEVTEAGTYGVEAAYVGIDCSFEGTRKIEFFPLVNDATGDPVDMTVCDASGFHTFDLTSNLDVIVSLPTDPANYSTTIHLTEQDAKDNVNAIDPADYTAFTNTVEDLQTLWTRTVYSVTTCIGIKSFDLIVQDLTPQYTIDSDFSICDGTSDTIDVVITDTDPNPVTYTWTKDGTPLPDTTPSITVNEAGAYTVVLDRTGCTATSTVNVVVTPIPVADAPADVTVCESYELPALSANNTYHDAVTNAVVPAGTVITVTTTFNVVASSGTTPECTSQNTFTVTVNNALVIPAIADVAACDNYILPALTVGNYYTETGGASGTGTQLNAGDEITASQTIFVYAETGTTPNCTSEISFEVEITASPIADAPADVEACDGYVLPALSAGNTYWTEPNGTGTQIAAGVSITSTQLIYVFAQNAANTNCTDENSFNVTITPTPAFSLGENRVACLPSNVTITVTGSNYNEADASYAWTVDGNPVSGGKTITASIFGTYEVTVTVKNCSHSESVEVEENLTPVALLITDGCENGVYMIEVSDENGSFDTETASYAWTGPGTFVSDKREFAATAEGEYFVTVTTAEGCIGEDSIIVTSTSCTIQKGISPNNDDLNDNFDLSELMVKHLSIFNRYGEEVYSKDNYKNEWVGQTNSGKELPTGTYFYMIELTGGESKTGWIYINRQD